MQAQDFRSMMWAIGLRLHDTKLSEVEKAYNSGTILRTHVMRPTWHIVARENLSWLLDLTAAQVLSQTKGRLRDLELTPRLLKKCHSIIEKEMDGANHLTREEISLVLTKSKLSLISQQLSHILMDAELHKLICSGRLKNNKISYALFDERVAKQTKLTHEEALAKLARIYFASHGPALIEDFQWWSGLSLGKAKLAVAAIEKDFSTLIVDDKKFYFFEEASCRQPEINAHYLLPAYDEFVISYKDRSGMFKDHTYAKAISNNGVFRPVIVNGEGRIIGIWSQTTRGNQRFLGFQFFENETLKVSRTLEKEMMRYSDFSNIQTTVKK